MPNRGHKRPGKTRTNSRSTYSGGRKSKSSSTPTVVVVGIVVGLLVLGAVYFMFGNRNGDFVGPEVTTASGLKYRDRVKGTGATPQTGQNVTVHYTGTLENGTKFDSSLDSGQPITFPIGTGSVIKGWDEGLMTMKVGGKRQLIIPSTIGYGDEGRPPQIPPRATLVFEVELLGAQ